MKSNLYFAYGSNLNRSDLLSSKYGFNSDELKFFSIAILDDFDLRFTRFSTSRKGGVLDIVRCKDSAIPGVLFEVVNEEAWRKLDAKEGAPRHYERVSCEFTSIDDVIYEGTTYQVIHKLDFVKPRQDYIEIVRQGLIEFGLPDDHLNRAVLKKYPTSIWSSDE